MSLRPTGITGTTLRQRLDLGSRLDHVLHLGVMQKNQQGAGVGVSALDTLDTEKKKAVLKEMAYKYVSMRLTTYSGTWVTNKVFDVSFHVEVRLKEPVENELVKTIKDAVVVSFLAKDGQVTPNVRMQTQNVGYIVYDYDIETDTGQQNELVEDLEKKMGTIVLNAAKMFEQALFHKYPNLELVQIEPESKEWGYLVRLRGSDDVLR